MKICPTCGEVYPLADVHCRVHGVELQDWSEATQVVVLPESEEHTHLDPVPGTATAGSGRVARALRSRPATRVHMDSTDEGRARVHASAPRGGRLLADRYRLSRQLGIGGYGAVFDAFDERLEKRVAVKVLSPALAQRPDVLERFRREAIAASQIRHSGIVDVSDFAADSDGSFFIVMELLDGIDLADLIAERGTIAVESCLEIVRQCAEALTAAHAAGILHRDLKPANIFLTGRIERNRYVKIIDFGICKLRDQARMGGDLTSASKVVGTPAYMSPEQAMGRKLDGRVDVYSLGVILFEMLAGERPFTGRSALEILTAHIEAPRVPPSSVNPLLRKRAELDALVMRAIAAKPRHRFASMSEFSAAIARVLLVDRGQPEEANTSLGALVKTVSVKPLSSPSPLRRGVPATGVTNRRLGILGASTAKVVVVLGVAILVVVGALALRGSGGSRASNTSGGARALAPLRGEAVAPAAAGAPLPRALRASEQVPRPVAERRPAVHKTDESARTPQDDTTAESVDSHRRGRRARWKKRRRNTKASSVKRASAGAGIEEW